MHLRGFGQGGLPRKGSRTKSFLPGNAFGRFSRLWPVSGSPQERLQNKIVLTSKCLPEALARGSPQQRFQNKILITRKGSRARFLLPGNAFQGLWPRGPPRKGTRRLFLPGNAFQRLWWGIPPRKSSRTRLLLPGNAFRRLWPGGPPRKGTRRKLFLPGNAFQRLWRGIPPRKSSRTKLLLPGNAFQRLWPGSPPRNGSRTRSFLPGNAFQRLWPGCPPGKALEQHRYYQEVPSTGFGQRVLAGGEFHGTQGRARTKALRSRQNEKAPGGPPVGLSGSPCPFHLSSGSCLGSLEFPPPICF